MKSIEFNKIWGIDQSTDDQRRRFVNRVEHNVFKWIEDRLEPHMLSKVFDDLCLVMGENRYALLEGLLGYREPKLKYLTNSDYVTTLKLVVAVFELIPPKSPLHSGVNDRVLETIGLSDGIGIRWVSGMFYPVGEPILDSDLLEHSLRALNDFDNEHKDLSLALRNYQAGNSYGVVDNCYKAVEGLTRRVLGNKGSLDKNRVDLLKYLNPTKEWGAILSNYIIYAHEHHRHAGEDRHNVKASDVEAYLYMTCLIIRLVVRLHNEQQKDQTSGDARS